MLDGTNYLELDVLDTWTCWTLIRDMLDMIDMLDMRTVFDGKRYKDSSSAF